MKLNDIKSPTGEFYKLQDGNNELRIVSDPEVRSIHFNSAENKANDCVGKEYKCQYCISGEKPTIRYMFYIIDRRDGSVKQAQFPWTVVKQYKALASTKDYAFADLPDYDLTIKKEGQGLLTKYTLIPGRAAVLLTDEEKSAIATQIPLSEVIEKLKFQAVENNNMTAVEDLKF